MDEIRSDLCMGLPTYMFLARSVGRRGEMRHGASCCSVSHIAGFATLKHCMKINAMVVKVRIQTKRVVPVLVGSSIISPVGTMSRSVHVRGDTYGRRPYCEGNVYTL